MSLGTIDEICDKIRKCRLTYDEHRELADLVERMAAALKPFADCMQYIEDDEPDREWAKFRLEVGDYRRAKAALDA